MTFGSKLAPVPADFSIGKVIQWTVSECENDEHLTGSAISERRRKPIPVTLTRNHTSDFLEHQALLMRYDLSIKKDQQREGIYWSHLSYINISMKKILIEFSRRSTLPQKFEDCTVNLFLFDFLFLIKFSFRLDRLSQESCRIFSTMVFLLIYQIQSSVLLHLNI